MQFFEAVNFLFFSDFTSTHLGLGIIRHSINSFAYWRTAISNDFALFLHWTDYPKLIIKSVIKKNSPQKKKKAYVKIFLGMAKHSSQIPKFFVIN